MFFIGFLTLNKINDVLNFSMFGDNNYFNMRMVLVNQFLPLNFQTVFVPVVGKRNLFMLYNSLVFDTERKGQWP